MAQDGHDELLRVESEYDQVYAVSASGMSVSFSREPKSRLAHGFSDRIPGGADDEIFMSNPEQIEQIAEALLEGAEMLREESE